jgi:hypothetical protein
MLAAGISTSMVSMAWGQNLYDTIGWIDLAVYGDTLQRRFLCWMAGTR